MSEMKYLTIDQVCEDFPFTKGQIRYFLMHRKENGINTCLRKIGKRIYIRKDLLEKWIDSQVIEDCDE